MVPGSARTWIAVNAVQQSNLNKKMKTKIMTTLQLRKSIGRSHLRRGLLLVSLAIATFGLTFIFNPVAAHAQGQVPVSLHLGPGSAANANRLPHGAAKGTVFPK